jgi:hypothetical protein
MDLNSKCGQIQKDIKSRLTPVHVPRKAMRLQRSREPFFTWHSAFCVWTKVTQACARNFMTEDSRAGSFSYNQVGISALSLS